LFATDFTSKIHLPVILNSLVSGGREWFSWVVSGFGFFFFSSCDAVDHVPLLCALTRGLFMEEEICPTAKYVRAFVKKEVA